MTTRFNNFNKKEYELHYNNGIRFGYPKCCVEQFATEAAIGIVPIALHRARKYGFSWKRFVSIGPDYVMCDKCFEEYVKKFNIKR